MNGELIQVKENQNVTTSLLVAEKFNKDHKNVIRKIETLLSDISTGSKLSALKLFEKSEYIDTHGQPRIMYYINRDGFTLLAMGFTGREALEWKLKYINAFNEMERHIKNPTLKDSRLDIARLLVRASRTSVEAIKQLYPEYFTPTPSKDSLEYISDVNTSYTKWLEDCGISSDWITSFPTSDIYNNYLKYCTENRFLSMGKKTFYATVEKDFNFVKKQFTDGHRYFRIA